MSDTFINDESMGIPEDLIRRRGGLYPTLLGMGEEGEAQPQAQPQPQRPMSRTEPDSGLASKVAHPDDSASESPYLRGLEAEQQRLSAPVPSPTLKQRLIQGATIAGPLIAAHLFGGKGYGAATGAAQGVESGLHQSQIRRDLLAQQRRQEQEKLADRIAREQQVEYQQRAEDERERTREAAASALEGQRETATRATLADRTKAEMEEKQREAKDRETIWQQHHAQEQTEQQEREGRQSAEFDRRQRESESRAEAREQRGEERTIARENRAAARTEQQKVEQPVEAARQYGHDYLERGYFTGPGDEALLEKFFDLAKPSSGFRMTKQQIDLLRESRSWTEGAQARIYHALHGTWFSPQQRRQIVSTMDDIANAKIASMRQSGGAVQPGTTANVEINSKDPLGILQ